MVMWAQLDRRAFKDRRDYKELKEMLANPLILARHLHQRRPRQVLIFRHCILLVMVIFILVHHYYIYQMEQNGLRMAAYYLAREIKVIREYKVYKVFKAHKEYRVRREMQELMV